MATRKRTTAAQIIAFPGSKKPTGDCTTSLLRRLTAEDQCGDVAALSVIVVRRDGRVETLRADEAVRYRE